ncbi:hypothetical protein DCCM_3445 [Desulfocucumis palustris]|uniref:Uncharacterized protein n=1 Tax=Desulfocucumis palustris TaxID=1898651 RepID=A0A2L2XF71_9FIRM|nr:hypothetical protein DCCM_3445 [Desulfocucumis palustris]
MKAGDKQAVRLEINKVRGHTSLLSIALGSEECPQRMSERE